MTYSALPQDPNAVERLAYRFWPKVAKRADGCWEWTGSLTRGYGQIEVSQGGARRNLKAHRVAYELVVGPIPDALPLDHLCRNPRCVNPGHLEPVTTRENTRRGRAGMHAKERAKAQTHCKRGHAYTAVSTYRVSSTGHRQCRVCCVEATRRWRDRNRAELQREWQS